MIEAASYLKLKYFKSSQQLCHGSVNRILNLVTSTNWCQKIQVRKD